MADIEPVESGTFILPILERLNEGETKVADSNVRLERAINSLIKSLNGFGGDGKGGRSGGKPAQRNPVEPKVPDNLMNIMSFFGEKKDKAIDVIKKGFFKLFKTDYFGNLFKAINNLAKALTNSFMSWLEFFLMMAFIDPSGGFLRDIINLFVEIGMILFKTITPLIPVAVKMMFNTIVYVFKMVLSLLPSIISTIMQTFTQLGNTFPILKPIISFINQFLGALRQLFVILNNPKADKKAGFSGFLSKVFAILKDILLKTIDLVVEYMPKILSWIIDFFVNTIIPGFINLAPKILNGISSIIDELIKKYPNLKVWIQPFKDILEMLSNFIGSFAKFDSKEYIQGLDEYKKKEKELFSQKSYKGAGEDQKAKMLEAMQNSFIAQNSQMIQQAQDAFNKSNQNKLNIAKERWNDFLDHILDTLGAAYKALPTEAKAGIWTVAIGYLFLKLVSFGTWISTNMVALTAIGNTLMLIGGKLLAFGGMLMTGLGTVISFIFSIPGLIVIGIIAIFALLWYFWDDISDFFVNLRNNISDWWDNVKIIEPLMEFLNDFIKATYEVFIEPFESILDDFVEGIKTIIFNISEALDSFTNWWKGVKIIEPMKNLFISILDTLYEVFIEPFVSLWNSFTEMLNNVKLPDWLTSIFNPIGGGTDADDLKRKSTKEEKGFDFKEFTENQKKAENNYYKSSLHTQNTKNKLNRELMIMNNAGYFDKQGAKLSEKLENSLNTKPINLKNITANVKSVDMPSITQKVDVKVNPNSLNTFYDDLKTIFKKIVNYFDSSISTITKTFTYLKDNPTEIRNIDKIYTAMGKSQLLNLTSGSTEQVVAAEDLKKYLEQVKPQYEDYLFKLAKDGQANAEKNELIKALASKMDYGSTENDPKVKAVLDMLQAIVNRPAEAGSIIYASKQNIVVKKQASGG